MPIQGWLRWGDDEGMEITSKLRWDRVALLALAITWVLFGHKAVQHIAANSPIDSPWAYKYFLGWGIWTMGSFGVNLVLLALASWLIKDKS